MRTLLDPINPSAHCSMATLALQHAPRAGYNRTALASVRILRSDAILEDVPVLYRPGAVFVLQGSKQGFLDGNVYRYDADHYLTVSVPVPFRMASQASPEKPLLAIYVDLNLCALLASPIPPILCCPILCSVPRSTYVRTFVPGRHPPGNRRFRRPPHGWCKIA